MKHHGALISTFFLFSGQAEEAMNFYTSLFAQSEIIRITRFGPNEAGKEGTVQQGVFSVKGQVFMCTDSTVAHAFTPAMSLYVTCESENEIDQVFQKLAQDGQVLMPLASYPFSEKFGWVQDRFGVSWQLSLRPAMIACD